jgi:RNA polymerase sigma-70 factor (ECF subfamily)
MRFTILRQYIRQDLTAQWEVVEASLAAAREGDFDALVAVLDPHVVLRAGGGRTSLLQHL